MDLEYFWAAVAWAIVIGGGVLVAFVLYYWFAVVPDRELAERRSPAAPAPAGLAREARTATRSEPVAH